MAPQPTKTDGNDSRGWDPDEQGDVAVEDESEVKEPRLYHVLLHNDDYTTMDFVVKVLMDIFHQPHETAMQIMLNVHEKGVGVAGMYSFEVAEAKAEKAMLLARQNEFPLRCSVEAAS